MSPASRAEPPRPPGAPPERTSSNVEAMAAELAPLIAAHLVAVTREAEPLIDAEAAGVLLGVPATWVRAQARAGAIPHVRLGHYVRFDRAELLEWRAAQASGARTGTRPVPESSKMPMNAGRATAAASRGTNGGTG